MLRRRPSSRPLSDTVFVMVANRLTEPGSKRRTITEWLSTVALARRGRCPRASIGATGPSMPSPSQGGDRGASLLRALQLREPGSAPCLLRPHLLLFRDGRQGAASFPSLAFGYSRDHRADRPQVVIGLLVTSDGIPIAHHVFSGNTADVSTLPSVMEDLQQRFGVGRIALVADRGLISEDNLALVDAHGFDHVLATRLHHDEDVAAVLEKANAPDQRLGGGSRGAQLLSRSRPWRTALCRGVLARPLSPRPCAAPELVRQGRGRPHRHRGKGAVGPSHRPGQDRRGRRPSTPMTRRSAGASSRR